MLIFIFLGFFSFWLGVLTFVNLVRDKMGNNFPAKAKPIAPPLREAAPARARMQARATLREKNAERRPEIVRAFQDLWKEIVRGA